MSSTPYIGSFTKSGETYYIHSVEDMDVLGTGSDDNGDYTVGFAWVEWREYHDE